MKIACLTMLTFGVAAQGLSAQEDAGSTSYGQQTSGYIEIIEKVRKAEAECIQVIDGINKDIVMKADGTPPYVLVQKREIQAIYFVQSIRSVSAVTSLVRFLGLAIVEKNADSSKFTFEKTADKALQDIGLPSVDEIIREIKNGKIAPKNYDDSWNVLKGICGKETVIERVRHLGFHEDPTISIFLKIK